MHGWVPTYVCVMINDYALCLLLEFDFLDPFIFSWALNIKLNQSIHFISAPKRER